jgi:hypothetical protein
VHGVHHQVKGGIEELLGSFGVEALHVELALERSIRQAPSTLQEGNRLVEKPSKVIADPPPLWPLCQGRATSV